MGAAKFEITRKCKICGEPFVAKTITSWYSHQDVLKLHLNAEKMKRKEMSVWML